MMTPGKSWPGKSWLVAVAVAIAAIGVYYAFQGIGVASLPQGFASGNGRLEAVEIDISAKAGGRLGDIFVNEGDFVRAGQSLAIMDTAQLEARKRQAQAELRRARIAIETANSVVNQREAERATALAVIEQRQAELDGAASKLARSEQLIQSNSVSQQALDNDRAAERGARANLGAAKAQLAASEAAISAAKAQVIDAEAAVDAAQAVIESIDTDIADGTLRAPRDGRVQFRVAQPGEVLAGGGRVINMVDLSDVFMTFFLPTEQAGRLALGSEVRLVLDAAPQYVVPASVSFVSNVAQFTPKTVETEQERQKLMFRVRARIPPELLRKYIELVKTGVPGVAYVRIDPNAQWPSFLEMKAVQ